MDFGHSPIWGYPMLQTWIKTLAALFHYLKIISSPHFPLFWGKLLISQFLGVTPLYNLGKIFQNTNVLSRNAACGFFLTYSKSAMLWISLYHLLWCQLCGVHLRLVQLSQVHCYIWAFPADPRGHQVHTSIGSGRVSLFRETNLLNIHLKVKLFGSCPHNFPYMLAPLYIPATCCDQSAVTVAQTLAQPPTLLQLSMWSTSLSVGHHSHRQGQLTAEH